MPFQTAFTLLFLLFAMHMLFDFPLQGQFLSDAKAGKVLGVPSNYALLAHSLLQAFGVYVITHSIGLAIAEWGFHFAIDNLRVQNKFSFIDDQFLHYACKLLYVVLLAFNYPAFKLP